MLAASGGDSATDNKVENRTLKHHDKETFFNKEANTKFQICI